ncbi:MAG: hypothetical protein ACD_49C00085G0011 [uncultured bacterium (gcode 4)]|uniref:Uncharacterized protein n=1 Tax=uncultured bacterium (gcode 4) TaxID=1234023 RepID=K2AVV5_9BACT|nr:MAG: hypothetical protein ACD_49C00085G0011 [uncultured bacterium (gcode 4)]
MLKDIISQWGNKPAQAITWTWKVQEVKAISAEKIEKILDYMKENDMALRKLEEHLECMGINDSPEIIAQIKWSDKFILGSLKEKFLNHKTKKLAKELIELTETMLPDDALLALDWWYDNSKWKIQKMFEEAQMTPAKLVILLSKDMKLDDAIELLQIWLYHTTGDAQTIFVNSIVSLTNNLEPKEAIGILNKFTFNARENRKILEKAIIFHTNIIVEQAKKSENPRDSLEILDSIFYYSNLEEAQKILEEAMITPAKSFAENTKNMSQKWFWETLKWRKGQYIRNSLKIWFDIMTWTKRTKDILETLEEGFSDVRWEAKSILIGEIINFVIENYEPQEALKILKQKQKLFLRYSHEINPKSIIKLISELDQKEILKTLKWWFNNSEIYDFRIIYANEIINFVANLEPQEALKILSNSYGHDTFTELKRLFIEAMITPAKSLIESTKNMPQKEALKTLRSGRGNSDWKSVRLFQDEIKYRSNLSQLNEIVRN